uniref:Secreted protein n=1 Tax=Steinernema glaseri TaxID=37863 RepID=A0A1I8AHT3_9BILA
MHLLLTGALLSYSVFILLLPVESFDNFSLFVRNHNCTQKLKKLQIEGPLPGNLSLIFQCYFQLLAASPCQEDEFEFMCIYYCWCCKDEKRRSQRSLKELKPTSTSMTTTSTLSSVIPTTTPEHSSPRRHSLFRDD